MTTPHHADGIYFGLPEAVYHADRALGSTNIKRLLQGPAEYWFEANRERDPDEAEKAFLRFGRAVHKFVLEGAEDFEMTYFRSPDDDDRMAKTDADLRDLLRDHVAKMPASKGEKIKLARAHDLAHRCLDAVLEDARLEGFLILPADEYDRAVAAAKAIEAVPDLAQAFRNGFAEVSIFWTVNVDGFPVRKKARFDFLKRNAIVDLKSIGNVKGLPFPAACRAQIASLRYDVQAEHYLEGRSMIEVFLDREDGLPVFEWDPVAGEPTATAGEDDRIAFLADVAASSAFGWAWVFFHSGDAPLVWGSIVSPGNPILDIAREDVDAAVKAYVDASKTFAPGEPWLPTPEVGELELSQMPGWFGARKREAK